MGLFAKNPNESKYVGGKKHFVEVIKSSGNVNGNMPADALIWRYPAEDFNTKSTLVVMPGESAIFVNKGVIEEVFNEGSYKLDTQNYPFLSRILNSVSGGVSAYHCVVYYVRMNVSMELKWGTDSPIQVRDKMLGLTTKLGARGSYQVRVSDPTAFLKNVLGATGGMLTAEDIKRYVKSTFLSKIKSNISAAIQSMETEIMGIDAHMDEISQTLMPMIQAAVAPYGLLCVSFSIIAIDILDDEYRRMYDEAIAARNAKMLNADADRYTMNALGNQWAAQQSFEIMNKMAENKGEGSGAMGVGMDLGMGMATGMAFAGMAQQTFANVQQPYGQMPQQPYGQMPQQPYGQAPQQPAAAPAEDPMETLAKLKKLLDAGLIEQAEYDAKKAEVLSRM